MPVCPVIHYPDPRLKHVCSPLTLDHPDLHSYAQDLLDTMDAAPPRTVGIAAPQIGIMHRLIIVDSSRNPKFTGSHGLMTLINPEIIEHDGEQVFREGCLSIPDFTANIRRWDRIVVTATDLAGTPVRVTADGFESVVLQHEIDHINGILFLDKVANAKTDLFQRKAR